MKFKKNILSIAVVAAVTTSTLFLTGCAGNQTYHAASYPNATQEQQHTITDFYKTTDEYFYKNLALNPLQSPELGINKYNDRFGDYLTDSYLKKQKALEEKYLSKVNIIDRTLLPQPLQIAYDQFIYDRKMALRGFEFPSYLLPLNQFYSRATTFAELGTGTYSQPFKTVQDYENFLKKSDGFARWTDNAIVRMREGMKKGVVLPEVLVDMIVPQLKSFVQTQQSGMGFWQPITHLPANFTEKEKAKLTEKYEEKINNVIHPAYLKLATFMDREYKGRKTTGYKDLPNGEAWYQYLADLNTTTTLPASEIHKIGLEEVKRILSEMEKTKKSYGFKGTLKEFFTYLQNDKFYWTDSKKQIDDYMTFSKEVDEALPKFFNNMPLTPYKIRPVPKSVESSAGVAYYNGGNPDGSRPGIFFVNTEHHHQLPKWSLETLFLHEATPGHHFQVSLKQEMSNAPTFQKYSDYTAYDEGWSVYVESLGQKMGFETEPLQYFGKLNEEMLRAMRLVVDTGIHQYGWSPEKAAQFMKENSALGDGDIYTEVRRYTAIPGQALSYKIGQLTISRLSAQAQQTLRDDFDIRQFHDQILDSGSLPMTILKAKVDHWIEQKEKTS